MNERRPSTGFRRVVVALDASRHSEAALEAAARLCAIFNAELCGIFVEDLDVLRAAELPFTVDVGRFSRSSSELSGFAVRRMFRAQESRARRAFDWTVRQHRLVNHFRVVSGDVARQLLEAAEEADLITLGQSGSVVSSRQKLGTVTRTVLAGAVGPVLVLRRGLRLDLPVMVVFDCESEERYGAIRIAADLARQHPDSPLVVLLSGSSRAVCAEAREELVQQRITGDQSPEFERVHCDLPELVLERAHRRRAGLLIVPADSRGAGQSRVHQLVANADVPVMIIPETRVRVPA